MNEDMIISMATAVLLSAIKNAKKKAAMKKIALKIYQTIKSIYAGDPDFA